jgi:hypothetical protein
LLLLGVTFLEDEVIAKYLKSRMKIAKRDQEFAKLFVGGSHNNQRTKYLSCEGNCWPMIHGGVKWAVCGDCASTVHSQDDYARPLLLEERKTGPKAASIAIAHH